MDTQTQRALVGTLGLVMIVSLIGALALAFTDRVVPDGLWATIASTVAVLAALATPKGAG